MKEKLGCTAIIVAVIVYLGIGFVQFLAMIKGMELWFNIPWILAAVLSLIVAYIPVVGTIAGIKGATDAWGWGLWPAIAFFCVPYLLYIVAITMAGIVDIMKRKRQ